MACDAPQALDDSLRPDDSFKKRKKDGSNVKNEEKKIFYKMRELSSFNLDDLDLSVTEDTK